MLLCFTDLMNVTEEVTIPRPNIYNRNFFVNCNFFGYIH